MAGISRTKENIMKETTDKRFDIQEPHLSLETMIAYIEGSLDKSENALVERIIQENPVYTAAIDSLRETLSKDSDIKERIQEVENAYDQELTSKAKSLQPQTLKSSTWGWVWKVAAAILILIAVSLSVMRLTRTEDNTQLARRYMVHYQDPIGVMSQLENQAFALYHNRQYAAAIPLFKQMLSEADALQINRVRMFLGVCLVQTNQPDKAQVYFHEIIRHDDSIYVSAAKWYMALSFLQQGATTTAQDILRDFIAQPITDKEGMDYQQQAKELLKLLSSSS